MRVKARPRPMIPSFSGSLMIAYNLDIQCQRRRFGARHANHDLALLFLVRQHQIAMVVLALGKAGAAGPPCPSFARTCQDVAMLAERIQNGNSSSDLITLSALDEFDLEGLVVGTRRGCHDEILKVHGRIRPVAGHIADGVHQAARTTTIKMGAALFFQHWPEIVGLPGLAVIMMEDDVSGQFARAELFPKGHRLRRSGEVVEFEVLLTMTDAL